MKLKRILRKTLAGLAMLLVFGLAKAPFEERLTRRFVASGLLAEPSSAGIRELVGQSTFLAVLGGLRPLVAIYTTLHAFDAWSYREWDTVERDYRVITTLLPEDIDSWKTGGWHMAYNAAASFAYDDPDLPEATRRLNSMAWVRKGVEFLQSGIEQNPGTSALHKELADIYREKIGDPCLAAEHYLAAVEGDAPQSYLRRFYAYSLARCPGREREAYETLMNLYAEGKSQRLPTLIQRIKELEPKLEIPEAKRIPEPDPDELIRRRYPNAQLP